MAWWGIGIAAAGTAFNVYTTYQSGQQIEANSQVEAQYQRRLTDIKEQKLRRQIPKSLGTQKAVLSKSGRSFSTGTGLDLVVESAGEFRSDGLCGYLFAGYH